MIKILFVFLLPLALNASKILSYNIYDRTDRVDLMITFDMPYDGVIKQSQGSSKVTIKLQDATIESSKLKNISSKYVNMLSITPMSGFTQIVASVPNTTAIKISKTSDAYGLRLRFTTKVATSKQSSNTQTKTTARLNPLTNLPTKQDTQLSQSYYFVTILLVVGVSILLFIRYKITPKTATKTAVKKDVKAWAFKETQDVSVRFQKKIDPNATVCMLEFEEQSYLLLLGSNNVLLDKFLDDKPVTQDDFESILQSRHQELDSYLKVQQGETNTPKNTHLSALNDFKEKAAILSYES